MSEDDERACESVGVREVGETKDTAESSIDPSSVLFESADLVADVLMFESGTDHLPRQARTSLVVRSAPRASHLDAVETTRRTGGVLVAKGTRTGVKPSA